MSTIRVLGQCFDLRPERCAFHRESRTLLCSDLHWGKAESFQRRGLAVPAAHLIEDLKRLDHAIKDTGAERVLVLGDLIHTPAELRPALIEQISEWRQQWRDLQLTVVRGNHDREHPWPESWLIEDAGQQLIEGDIVFSHDDVESTDDQFIWTGHIHPMIRLSTGSDSLRLPCFVVGHRSALLPAFTSLAGGFDVRPDRDARVFVITDEDVVEV